MEILLKIAFVLAWMLIATIILVGFPVAIVIGFKLGWHFSNKIADKFIR